MSNSTAPQWKTLRLGDVASKIQDGTHFSPASSHGPFRYLTSRNVRFGYIDLTASGWVSESEHRVIYRRCDPRRGDILLTKDGANTGNAAINTLDEQFSLLSSVAMLRFNPSEHVPGFYLQYLLSPRGQGQLKSQMSGNAITRLTLTKIKNLLVPVPLFHEQRRIAEILDALDKAIRSTAQLMSKLEKAGQGLRHDLLTRGIGGSGELRDPATSCTFANSELGLIPCDWRIVSAADIASKSHGSLIIGPFGSNLVANDYRSSGVPVVFVRDVQPDNFSWVSDVYVSVQKAAELSAHTVYPGDLVITKMGLPPAIAAVYPYGLLAGVVTADIIRLRPDIDVVDPAWLSLAINSDSTRRQIAAITGGVTRS